MAWNWVLPAIQGLAGYSAAQKQAAAINEQNDLAKEKFGWDKAKEIPGVLGAQAVIGAGNYKDADGNFISQDDYAALDDEAKKAYTFESQFQPFINSAGQTAVGAGNIANQYLGNVPHYQQAGLEGLQTYRNLAGLTPEQQHQMANDYTARYGQGVYDLAKDDINRNALKQDYATARQQGRFGALSSQKARADAMNEQARSRSILEAAERARNVGYERSQSELQRMQGLASPLVQAGTSGLSQASNAASLGSSASSLGINTPFAPFSAYGNTISAQPSATLPQFQQAPDPFATGLGLGVQAWSNFNQQQ